MWFFNKGKKPKEKKTNNAANKKSNKSSQSPSVISDTQQRPPQKGEKHDKEDELGSPDKQLIVCPEKKESIFSAANILTFVAVVISAISVTIAFQSNKEVAKQFEIANRPFLQFKEFKVIFIDEARKIRFEPNLTNYGNHPIRTVKYKIAFVYDTMLTNIYTEVKFTKPHIYQVLEAYYMKEKPEPFPLHTETILPPYIFEGVWDGVYNIYIWGEVIYENIVAENKRRYEFVVRLKKYKSEQTEEAIMYNKNENVR